ncbi:MAG TPA: methionine biosynthesis protein MetW [Burkholderiaceae bacterium]|nr:methionine biosynthesis protein MetW [Burkholderiaceae bacterium]
MSAAGEAPAAERDRAGGNGHGGRGNGARARSSLRAIIGPVSAEGLRPDLALVADWIPRASRVLDLGCGDGSLLAYLRKAKQCQGYGVEIDDAQVLACVERGVDVIQRNIEDGLDLFSRTRFDVVVLSMAIQATHQTERVLREMSEIGTEGIVSLPNFGHWTHSLSLLRGRMPVSRELPYAWYDTPNLHMATVRDFEDLLAKLDLQVTASAFLANGVPVRLWPSGRATQAIYRFRRR